jgi:hypothetical protein
MTLANLDAVLRELRCRTELEQRALLAKVQEENVALGSLKGLRDRLAENRAVFDGEDQAEIEAHISRRENRVVEMERELHRCREDIVRRETIFESIGQTIRARQEILDAAEQQHGVLTLHGELLAFFAKKQLTLEELLSREVQSLISAVAASPDEVRKPATQQSPASTGHAVQANQVQQSM